VLAPGSNTTLPIEKLLLLFCASKGVTQVVPVDQSLAPCCPFWENVVFRFGRFHVICIFSF
jgi:hypothetical protein